MKILVTGSAGHLGEALMRTLRHSSDHPVGIDIKPSEFTDFVGSIADRNFVKTAIAGCTAVLHTATLHKPHVGTHTRQDFVDTNITGTLNLLEEAIEIGCNAFIYTSTTSTFGDAMKPAEGEPAVWVTEKLRPMPKNIYGVTKTAAEDLCELFHRRTGLPSLVLKTARFFPEEDDARHKRDAFEDANLKVNELLFRRVDIADIVDAHRLALVKASELGFDKFIISGPTPFVASDAKELGMNAPAVLERYVPNYIEAYDRRGWRMFTTIDRVYDSSHAQTCLGWEPKYSFARAIQKLNEGSEYRSELAIQVGAKGYHPEFFEDGPYPVKGF